jgi:hypothetical protein
MPGMFWNISVKVWVGSSPATNVSEQSVWLTSPVATRTALSGRSTSATAAMPTTIRPRTTTTTLRTRRRASCAPYPRPATPFCSASS